MYNYFIMCHSKYGGQHSRCDVRAVHDGKVGYNKYLLLTEFEGRTVSYGPSFFLLLPSAERAGHKSKGKKRGSVTYSTDRENEVSKIFVISLVCVRGAQERFLFTRNRFKFLTHLESKTSQFEIVFKSLARFNT